MVYVPSTRRMLNVPLFIGTLLALAVLVPSLYAVRQYQVHRTAVAFLELAHRAGAEERHGKAVSYLQHYLALRPESPDIRLQLAEMYDKSALDRQAKMRAVALYFRALGVIDAAEQPPVRRRLGQLLLDVERHGDARAEATKLLTECQDVAGWRLLALARYGEFMATGLIETAIGKDTNDQYAITNALQQALAAHPRDVEVAEVAARVYRNHREILSDALRLELDQAQRNALADATMDNLVAASREDSRAYLARFLYRQQYGLPGANDDLQEALRLGPDSPEVLLTAADHARQKGDSLRRLDLFSTLQIPALAPAGGTTPMAPAQVDPTQLQLAEEAYAEARRHYQHLIDVAPQSANTEAAYAGLGDVLYSTDRHDEALETWRSGLRAGPRDAINFSLKARIAELLINRGDLAAADAALADVDAALSAIAPLVSQQSKIDSRSTVDLLHARRLLQGGQYALAIPLLRRATTGAGGIQRPQDNQLIQMFWMLGNVYAAVGQWDQAAVVYQEVATLRPDVPQPALWVARAWSAAGRPDLAIPYFQRVVGLTDAPEVWLALAEAELKVQAQLAPQQQSWEPFDRAVAQAERRDESGQLELGEAWRAALLRSEAERAKMPPLPTDRSANIEQVVEHYQQAETQFPDAVELFRRLVAVYEQLGRPELADRALARFTQLSDAPSLVCTTHSALLVARRRFAEAREVLTAGLQAETDQSEQRRLRAALAQVEVEDRQFEVADRLLRENLTQDSNKLSWLLPLAELALEARAFDKLALLEDEIRNEEGTTGSNWRFYRAIRLLDTSTRVNDPQFLEAIQLGAALRSQRPTWSPVYVLLGSIEERRDNAPLAIEHYQTAIRLGNRRLSVYEHLVYLLTMNNRFAEAETYLAGLKSQEASGLDDLAITIAARQGQTARAVEFARANLAKNPTSVRHIWLGQMLALDGQQAEAETEFLAATKMAPQDVQAWLALFGFYVRVNERAKAEATMASLISTVSMNDLERTFILAQGHEMLGDATQAEALYVKALQLAPDSPRVLARIASFYMPRDINKSIAYLDQLVKSTPDCPERKVLATLLANRAGKGDLERALKLLESTSATIAATPEDRRIHALLLTRRPGSENLVQAKQILEELLANSEVSVATDRLLLARVLLLQREYLDATNPEREVLLAKAKEEYVALVARQESDAAQVRELIQFLLTNDVFVADDWRKEAEQWLPKLAEVSLGTGTPEFAALSAHIDFLIKNNFDQAADAALQQFEGLLASQETPPSTFVARYIELQLARKAADKVAVWIDKLAASGETPQTILLRGRMLQAQHRSAELPTLVEDYGMRRLAAAKDDIERVQVLADTADLCTNFDLHDAAERWYQQLVAAKPQEYSRLVLCMARRGRMSDAIAMCISMAERDSSSRPFIILASALFTGTPSEKDLAQVEPFLKDNLSRFPQDVELKLAVAHIRFLQKRTDEAAKLYREVLELKPDHLIALNNLATLLAEQPGQAEEALRYVNQAIQAAGGTVPLLLDTKGMILFNMGRPELAVDPLRAATTNDDSNPVFGFHLAAVLLRLGDTQGAETAYRSIAQELPLQSLTAADKKLLVMLQQQFGQLGPATGR